MCGPRGTPSPPALLGERPGQESPCPIPHPSPTPTITGGALTRPPPTRWVLFTSGDFLGGGFAPIKIRSAGGAGTPPAPSRPLPPSVPPQASLLKRRVPQVGLCEDLSVQCVPRWGGGRRGHEGGQRRVLG